VSRIGGGWAPRRGARRSRFRRYTGHGHGENDQASAARVQSTRYHSGRTAATQDTYVCAAQGDTSNSNRDSANLLYRYTIPCTLIGASWATYITCLLYISLQFACIYTLSGHGICGGIQSAILFMLLLFVVEQYILPWTT
jgi:hypothetical protein